MEASSEIRDQEEDEGVANGLGENLSRIPTRWISTIM